MITSLRTAVGLFTVVPAGTGKVDRPMAARGLLWLPAIGGVLGGCAGAFLLLVPGRILGAVLAVAFLAVMTRCLHLDGLADTADGLGSGSPGPRALEIMRQSDIGPFGVVTLVLVLFTQIGALCTGSRLAAAGAITLAAGTGRLAILLAARSSVPCARPGGFGSLVAGSAGPRAVLASCGAAVLVSGGVAYAAGSIVRTITALVLGLIAGEALCRVAVRRFGGVTGDVFGAISETAATVTLVAIALLDRSAQ